MTTVLQTRIGALYQRPETQHWTCYELGQLVDIATRPDAMSEFEIIIRWRKKTPFFPRTVRTFLEKWNDSLDQARMAGIGIPKRPQPTFKKPELSEDGRKLGAELMAKLKKEL